MTELAFRAKQFNADHFCVLTEDDVVENEADNDVTYEKYLEAEDNDRVLSTVFNVVRESDFSDIILVGPWGRAKLRCPPPPPGHFRSFFRLIVVGL